MLALFEMLIENVFKKHNIQPHGIVHIGAHECEEYEIYKNDAKCDNIIWIEANPEVCHRVSNHRVYQYLISDTTGDEVDFIITNNNQSSSFLELKEHLIEHPNVIEQKRIKLKTITFDDFCTRENINRSLYDFLTMDIQGAELHALKGMNLDNFKYIYLEVNTKELYKGCGLLHDIIDLLAKNNFHMADINMTQHGWGDALFIKKYIPDKMHFNF
jgi:FkbM family methyltransferase